MARELRCRVCGAAMPRRVPMLYLTWILGGMTVLMLFIIPFIVGLATIVGGVAVIIGIFVGMVALYLFIKVEGTCDACRAAGKSR